jgi:outer membrane protein assembly factor BamE
MRLSRHHRWLSAAAASAILAGCSSTTVSPISGDRVFGLVAPYRMDIVQGNVVTQEQMATVRPGMTRVQVRERLGSPLLTDPFHADRWDYIFTLRRQGTEPQRRSVVLFFKGDTLERIEAPELPTEREFVASITRSQRTVKVPRLELSEAERQALPKPKPTEAPVPEVIGPVRDYPPLEPAR